MDTASYVYGLFESKEALCNTVTDLSKKGFDKNDFSWDDNAVLFPSISHDRENRYFVLFGAIGALVGGIAGAIASPTLHVTGAFQMLTPMMTMVAGAVMLAYPATWLWGFFMWKDTPVEADRLGVVTEEPVIGQVILSIAADTKTKALQAMESMEDNDAIEIVLRSKKLGKLETLHLNANSAFMETKSAGTKRAA